MGQDLLRLVESAAGGDPVDTAWLRLWALLEPELWDLVDRPRFASHLAHSEDSRRRIIGAIRTQLTADRCAYLTHYLDARRVNPRLGFTRWVRTIAKRIGMSYATYDERLALTTVRRKSARRITL